MGKNTTMRSLLASVIIYKKDDPLGVIFFMACGRWGQHPTLVTIILPCYNCPSTAPMGALMHTAAEESILVASLLTTTSLLPR